MDRRRCADLATLRLASRTSGMVVNMVRVLALYAGSPPASEALSAVGCVPSSNLSAIATPQLEQAVRSAPAPHTLSLIVPFASQTAVLTASRFGRTDARIASQEMRRASAAASPR